MLKNRNLNFTIKGPIEFLVLIGHTKILKISLKTVDNIDEAVEYYYKIVQKAKAALNKPSDNKACRSLNYPAEIRISIKVGRKLWKRWQDYRLSTRKTELNLINEAFNQIIRSTLLRKMEN